MGMVTTSSKAVARLREQLIHRCFEAGIGFRLFASTDKSGKGNYFIKVDRQQQADKVIDSGGVKLFLDPSSATQIRNYQLDYHDEPDGGFFLKTGQGVKGE